MRCLYCISLSLENMKNTLGLLYILCEFLVKEISILNSTISLINATLYQIKSKHNNYREYLDFLNNRDKTLLNEYSYHTDIHVT